jgi:hypothetical protein
MLVIGVVANPNTVSQKIGSFEWLPINLYINGDTFYYVIYGLLGRAPDDGPTKKAPYCDKRRGFRTGGLGDFTWHLA